MRDNRDGRTVTIGKLPDAVYPIGNSRKERKMDQETLVALANLDWLQLHAGGRLDFASGAVLADGEPLCLIGDLIYEGLTPATAPVLVKLPSPEDIIGKIVKVRITKRADDITNIIWLTPDGSDVS